MSESWKYDLHFLCQSLKTNVLNHNLIYMPPATHGSVVGAEIAQWM